MIISNLKRMKNGKCQMKNDFDISRKWENFLYRCRNFFRWLFILTEPVLLIPLIILSMDAGNGALWVTAVGCDALSFSPITILPNLTVHSILKSLYCKLCLCVVYVVCRSAISYQPELSLIRNRYLWKVYCPIFRYISFYFHRCSCIKRKFKASILVFHFGSW